MKREEWDKFCELLSKIEKKGQEIIEERTGKKNPYFQGAEIDGDMIVANFEVFYCGCCPGEIERAYFSFEDFEEED